MDTQTAATIIATASGSGEPGADWFKYVLVFILSSFIPITVMAFLLFRRTKKQGEFGRMVRILDISDTEGDFARERVAEQYASSNYILPVCFAFILSCLGFYSLLFGSDLVGVHVGKRNFLLTGLAPSGSNGMQDQRYQSMLVLSVAFCGAFLWSVQAILRRLNAGDLTPMVYFSVGIRMTVAPVLALMVSYILVPAGTNPGVTAPLPVVAFLIGFFPDAAMKYLQERFLSLFGKAASAISGGTRSSDDLPLSMIEGLDIYDRARLDELGIQDAQNLACANLIELVVRTSFNPIQLIDWIAQAKLYLYFKDDIGTLRKARIRNMFDLLPAAENEKYLLDIATETSLPVASLRRYCMTLTRDPGVKRLLEFQERLCAPSKGLDQVAGRNDDALTNQSHATQPNL